MKICERVTFLSLKGIGKGYLFCQNDKQKGTGLDLQAETPCIELHRVPLYPWVKVPWVTFYSLFTNIQILSYPSFEFLSVSWSLGLAKLNSANSTHTIWFQNVLMKLCNDLTGQIRFDWSDLASQILLVRFDWLDLTGQTWSVRFDWSDFRMNIFARLSPFWLHVSRTRYNIYYLKILNVIKELVNVQCAIIELWMHLGGLVSTQEARVALGYRFLSCLATSRVHQLSWLGATLRFL